MKRFVSPFLFILFSVSFIHSQEPKIEVTGVKKVVVEKVVPVEDGQIVKQDEFPLNYAVPNNGFGYVWYYPEGTKVIREANRLIVISAPKGELKIKAEYTTITIDFEKKTFQTTTHFLPFSIMVSDGPEPNPNPDNPDPPGPGPDAALTKKLKDAYGVDGKSDKLPGLIKGLALLADDIVVNKDYATNDNVVSVLRSTMYELVKPSFDLEQVRRVIELETISILPNRVGTPLTDDQRTKVKTLLQSVSSSLKTF